MYIIWVLKDVLCKYQINPYLYVKHCKLFKKESGRLFLKTPAEKRNTLDPTGSTVKDSLAEETSVSSAESERNNRPPSFSFKCNS